jgi:DNA-binding transcriptional LysR family regulator
MTQGDYSLPLSADPMDLIRVHYFERVARLGSFTRAAEELHIAQPALSKHIASLEQEIGHRVFDRSPRSVILTEAGRRLLEHADRLLENFDRLQAEMGQLAGSATYTHLRLGASTTVANNVLAPVLKVYMAQQPHVQVEVDSNISQVLIQNLVEGRSEAAIVEIPSFERQVTEELLFEEEFGLLMPEGHPWMQRGEIMFRELRDVPLIVRPTHNEHRDVLARVSRQAGFRPPLRAAVTSTELITAMVRDGIGPALVPAITLDGSLPWARIVEPRIIRQIGWLERTGSERTDTRTQFHEVLLAYCRQRALDPGRAVPLLGGRGYAT